MSQICSEVITYDCEEVVFGQNKARVERDLEDVDTITQKITEAYLQMRAVGEEFQELNERTLPKTKDAQPTTLHGQLAANYLKITF